MNKMMATARIKKQRAAKETPGGVPVQVGPQELMTLQEVAAYLRVPEATVRYWRHRGDGPPGFRVGKAVRFRRAAVDAWIDERETEARVLVGAR